ncbi:WD40 repeat-like protein [Pluteus cervinus]|uniref:WD40 repeat-like protein n=1 Tax=Pluteus cervinus TaxID=181527 RepID=A0ACD3BI31_9AGAR|nr:WD40 repeat-like protein [Pluteus cervinus]
MAITEPRPKLKTAFKNARSIAPLYTSGPVALTADGTRIVTCVREEVVLTDVGKGVEICRFVGDTQPINSFCITPSATHLLVFSASLSLRIYSLPGDSNPVERPIHPIRVISRAHDAPVHVCKVDPTSTYLASGSADGVVKVWNIAQGFVTHVFKGHGGVVSALAFIYSQDPSQAVSTTKMELVTASVDTRIRVFDLTASSSGKPQVVLEGHVSVPRGLDVSSDGHWLISGGRDSVVLIWDLWPGKTAPKSTSRPDKGKEKVVSPKLVKTIPVMERVEAVGLLRTDEALAGTSSSGVNLQFYTGGERGVVRIWDAQEGNVIFSFGDSVQSSDQEEQRQIVDVLHAPEISTLVSVHADQNILFHSLSTQFLTRQLIGFNDEIVDVTFLSGSVTQSDSHLAVATNSSLVRVYSLETFDARLLEGHTDIVLALDRSPDGSILASGSKDRSIRIWSPSASASNWTYGCVGICDGHSQSVGAVSFSRVPSPSLHPEQAGPQFMFSGSQDKTIKMWDLTGLALKWEVHSEPTKFRTLTTHKAHEKDINSLDVSPNNHLLVSGSQDRTAKIFEIEYIPNGSSRPARGELKLLGTCKGHKRGVWSVKFSRSEKVLASGSGDKTVKLWSLEDFSCLKTFEGHTNSVLRVDFLNHGMQLVTAASDGLVKLWSIREEECITTLDNHEDKVWALGISRDEHTIVSGAADSVITLWADCTEEQQQESEEKRTELALKEQDFLNYVALRDYRKAIQLALAMEQPGRLLSLFKQIRASREEFDSQQHGNASFEQVIGALALSDLAKLMRYIRDWNTNAKTSVVAQSILYAIVKSKSADDLVKAFDAESGETAFAEFPTASPSGSKVGAGALKELVDALLPYTERHLARLDRLMQESYMVDYILAEMDDGMFDGEELQDDMDVDRPLGALL